MKLRTTKLCMALLFLCAVSSYAQNRLAASHSLFDGFPAKINCTEDQLNNLFTKTTGQNASLSLQNELVFSGPVASNLVKYGNLQTVIVRLTAFKNTLFSLSRQTGKDNTYTYVGRILNPLYADGFELKHNKGANYQFIKIDVAKILVNCNQ